MTQVDPDIALTAMTRIWRSYGNEMNTPLLKSWRTMCEALNKAGQLPDSVGWTALAMPTGIGKTQFAALYCGLLPNTKLDPHNLRTVSLHPGVLFITRFVTEATKFVRTVNELAGFEIATSYHHNSNCSLTDAKRSRSSNHSCSL